MEVKYLYKPLFCVFEQDGLYFAISDNTPAFCFEGKSIEEVCEIAKRSLDSYTRLKKELEEDDGA